MSVQTTSSYDALRAAIVSGEIAPDARLVEAEVSATFGMSRGAGRTALVRPGQGGVPARRRAPACPGGAVRAGGGGAPAGGAAPGRPRAQGVERRGRRDPAGAGGA